MARRRLGRRERAVVRAVGARIAREPEGIGRYATARMEPHGHKPNPWEYNARTAVRINKRQRIVL